MLINRKMFDKYTKFTNRAIQFGEGNFLRCFIDWQIDILNEKGLDCGITIVRAIDGGSELTLNSQEGLYTTIIRGIDENDKLVEDKRIISSINDEIEIYKEYERVEKIFCDENLEYIFSNTTEAGIEFIEEDKMTDLPPKSFPGKLTKLLYSRYKKLKKGLVIIPCELIDYNGKELKKIVLKYIELWGLEKEFKNWIEKDNVWCSTLVDRIVTGYPRKEEKKLRNELGYKDNFMVAGEYFYLFVIQGPKLLEEKLKLKNSGLNILIVEDIKKYKERKVGILNGAHTSLVPVAYLYGMNQVRESVENKELKSFLEALIYSEIIPSLDMEKSELEEFAKSVIKRFENPYINHELIAISLNSMAKFKTRVLPQMLRYMEIKGEIPKKITFSLASLIVFYRGKRGNERIPIKDEFKFIELYNNLWKEYDGNIEGAKKIAESILALEHWNQNMNGIKNLTDILGNYIYQIEKFGMSESLKKVNR